jgi:hypothetical protein
LRTKCRLQLSKGSGSDADRKLRKRVEKQIKEIQEKSDTVRQEVYFQAGVVLSALTGKRSYKYSRKRNRRYKDNLKLQYERIGGHFWSFGRHCRRVISKCIGGLRRLLWNQIGFIQICGEFIKFRSDVWSGRSSLSNGVVWFLWKL